MRKRKIFIAILFLALLGMSVSYAWYHNNRQVSIMGGGDSSIRIISNGVLQVAYAVDDEFATVPVESARFSSIMEMKIDGSHYENVTGNGLMGQMWSPVLGSDGQPKKSAEFWEPAEADNAACDNDSGKYIIADLYFRSDSEMDIYIMKESGILPKTKGGNDLTNRTGCETKINFKDYKNGLPSLNINQSSFGLFSRNLIAGAARVSFTEYNFGIGESGAYPTFPGMIWVPNESYQLIKATTSGVLSKVNMEGSPEPSYSYYYLSPESGVNQFKEKQILRTTGKQTHIVGELFRNTGTSYEAAENIIVIDDTMYPGYKKLNLPIVPAIWSESGSNYIPAARLQDSRGNTYLVSADYDNTYSSGAYRTYYDGEYIDVLRTDDGYKKVIWDSYVGAWQDEGTFYTETDEIDSIEDGFIRDNSEYLSTFWIDGGDFTNKDGDNYFSKYKIGTTSQVGAGYYYTRIQIAVWVEGTDREADIQLNGGEFDVRLMFYGISK